MCISANVKVSDFSVVKEKKRKREYDDYSRCRILAYSRMHARSLKELLRLTHPS
jgi:hypothetical protein